MTIEIEKYQTYTDVNPKYYVRVDGFIADVFHSEAKAIECARNIHSVGFYEKKEILLTLNTTSNEQQ